MYFLGITRFSLFSPESDAWLSSRAAGKSEQAYIDYLYAPERIEPRLQIFGELSLPLLAAAADKYCLKHIVRYSEEMPERYKTQLQNLAGCFSFVVLEPHTAGKSSVNPYEIGYDMNSCGFGMYRLDDDDLVSVDFFDQVARYVQPEFAGMRVSLARGVTALYEDGSFSHFRDCYMPQIAIGLMSIFGGVVNGKMIAPPDVAHNRSDRYGSVVVNAEKVSWLWTRHVGQDTVYGGTSPKEAVKKQLLRFPALDSQYDVTEAFPTLEGRIVAPKHVELASALKIEGEGTWFELKAGRPTFSIKVDAEYAERIYPTSALLKFKVLDADGNIVPAGGEVEGLWSSSYEHIGYFRYLPTEPGRHTHDLEVSLPEGYQIVAIGIQPFGTTPEPFVLHSLAIARD